MFFQKTSYFILLLAVLLAGAYYLQPSKKGRGADPFRRYEWVKEWPELSNNITLGNPTGIAVDTSQHKILKFRLVATPKTGEKQ